jgi:hypothetical protein
MGVNLALTDARGEDPPEALHPDMSTVLRLLSVLATCSYSSRQLVELAVPQDARGRLTNNVHNLEK